MSFLQVYFYGDWVRIVKEMGLRPAIDQAEIWSVISVHNDTLRGQGTEEKKPNKLKAKTGKSIQNDPTRTDGHLKSPLNLRLTGGDFLFSTQSCNQRGLR